MCVGCCRNRWTWGCSRRGHPGQSGLWRRSAAGREESTIKAAVNSLWRRCLPKGCCRQPLSLRTKPLLPFDDAERAAAACPLRVFKVPTTKSRMQRGRSSDLPNSTPESGHSPSACLIAMCGCLLVALQPPEKAIACGDVGTVAMRYIFILFCSASMSACSAWRIQSSAIAVNIAEVRGYFSVASAQPW